MTNGSIHHLAPGASRVRAADFDANALTSTITLSHHGTAPVPSFWSRHWRGEYSLGRSFWLYLFAGTLLLRACELFGLNSLPRPLAFVATHVVDAGSAAYLVWSVRGTWAASKRCLNERPLSAWLTRAGAIACVLLWLVWCAAPELWSMRIAQYARGLL